MKTFAEKKQASVLAVVQGLPPYIWLQTRMSFCGNIFYKTCSTTLYFVQLNEVMRYDTDSVGIPEAEPNSYIAVGCNDIEMLNLKQYISVHARCRLFKVTWNYGSPDHSTLDFQGQVTSSAEIGSPTKRRIATFTFLVSTGLRVYRGCPGAVRPVEYRGKAPGEIQGRGRVEKLRLKAFWNVGG